MGTNEDHKAEEDLILKLILESEQTPPRDRLTPRMEARTMIDALDAWRRLNRSVAR